MSEAKLASFFRTKITINKNRTPHTFLGEGIEMRAIVWYNYIIYFIHRGTKNGTQETDLSEPYVRGPAQSRR
jgi:hypothetical protein